MFSFGKSKKIANIVIDDYVIRLVQNNGHDFESIKLIAEKALPLNLVENGMIVDELAFYDFMKELVREWGIRNNQVRFFVPDSLIIVRTIDIPKKVEASEWKEYLYMEIGHTIHFPFKNPVLDIYTSVETEEAHKVTVVAAPEEEIIKYVSTFEDASLKPNNVGIQALGVYRYFLHQQQEQIGAEKVFLFAEFNLSSVNISIFREENFEFHRHQLLNIDTKDWEATGEGLLNWHYTGDQQQLTGEINDQLNELERLLNFYRFSIHQGDIFVTDIVLLGDFPNLHEVARRIKDGYEQKLTLLSTENTDITIPVSDAFIPVLGLAIKGGK